MKFSFKFRGTLSLLSKWETAYVLGNWAYVSWSTSELRVRLAPLNRFKPSSKIFYWPFQGGTSFVDLLCFCSVLCLLCFVRVCLYVLCGHLLGKGWPLGFRLWCLLWVCHFPIGILGQVWYLIVSIPDLCNLITFNKFFHTSAQMGISCIKCVLEEVWKANSQNSQPTQFLRYFKYLFTDKTDHQILHLSILHTI